MKNILLFTKNSIKRSKLFLSLSIGGGIILCFLLYYMGGLVDEALYSDTKLGIIDQDQSVLSKDFKDYLTEKLHYKLIDNLTYDELSTELIDKNISVIIEIPSGFYLNTSRGNMQDITITALDDFVNAAFLEAHLNSYLGSISMLSKGAAGVQEVFNRSLSDYRKEDTTVTKAAALEMDSQLVREREGFINTIGFYLMLIFGLSIILSYVILEDRLIGVFSRIKLSPIKPVHYIFGAGIFGMLTCSIEIIIYVGYIHVSGFDIGFPLRYLVLMMVLFSLFVVCFASAIALAFKSKSTLGSSSMAFGTLGCIMGGAYFPLDLAPTSLQNIAKILPQYWFMDALRNLQANQEASILPNVIILSLFTLLTFLIGAVLFAQNNNSN